MMKLFRGCLALGMALALAACGGGGGGGDANVQISFTPASVNITSLKGVAGSQVVTANITASGVTSSNLFIGGEGGEVVLADAQILSRTSTTVSLQLIARADLAVGTYRDELRVLLCRDEACNSQYPGSPVRLPVTYVVQPTLEVAPLLSATRTTAEALTRVSTPITLPEAGLPVQATLRQTGVLPGLFSASIVDGALVVDLGYAPPGLHQGIIDLRSADGRHAASTTVNYQVVDAGGSTSITFEEPTVNLQAAQGQTLQRRLNVSPPNWSPVLSYEGATGSPELLARAQVVNLGPGQYELRINTQGLLTGPYFMTLGYRSSDSFLRFQSVNLNVDANLTATAVNLSLSSQSPAGPFSGSSAVTMADGSRATWVADPATVPVWMTLTRSSGRTGTDPLTFTVDPTQLLAGPAYTAQVGVSVDAPGVTPTAVAVVVQDNLPRLRAAATPVLELGQTAKVLLSGYFPEDVTANGVLEVSGATAQFFSRVNTTTLEGFLTNLTPGVPVEFRVRYPSFTSRASIDVKAAPSTTAPQVFPFGFGNTKPPVYSARHQSFYFVADGAIQRLAHQGGTWVQSSVAAPGVVDLDLDPDEARLVVLGFAGIDTHDPVTLARLGRLRSFADFELSLGVPLSRMKNIGTTLDGQLSWIADSSTCAGRLQRVPLAQPEATPTESLLACNGTTSQASLIVNRSRRYLTLFQADSGKPPLSLDTVMQRSLNWNMALGHFQGLAATRWGDASIIDNTGRWLLLFFESGSVSQSIGGIFPASVPAGIVAAGYGYREVSPAYLAYGYVRGTDGQGAPAALTPRLIGVRDSVIPLPQDTVVNVELPQPVGCLPGRPANEPCDHRAHLLTDQSGRNVLILGPQAAIVMQVPEPVTASSLAPGGSIMKRRLSR